MSDLPLLLPVQQELLAAMIEAEGRSSADQRGYFYLITNDAAYIPFTSLRHPGLDQRIFAGDLAVLAHHNLILMDQDGTRIVLLPAAYLYYGLTRQTDLPEVRAAVRGVIAGALDQARRALRVLERTKAGFGELHVPVHIVVELEAKREEVQRLEQRLNEFDAVQSSGAA